MYIEVDKKIVHRPTPFKKIFLKTPHNTRYKELMFNLCKSGFICCMNTLSYVSLNDVVAQDDGNVTHTCRPRRDGGAT